MLFVLCWLLFGVCCVGCLLRVDYCLLLVACSLFCVFLLFGMCCMLIVDC